MLTLKAAETYRLLYSFNMVMIEVGSVFIWVLIVSNSIKHSKKTKMITHIYLLLPWGLIVWSEYSDTQEIWIAFWILIITKFKIILIKIFPNLLSPMTSVCWKFLIMRKQWILLLRLWNTSCLRYINNMINLFWN